MKKSFTKGLFFILFFTFIAYGNVFGQTITVGSVDPGPYAPGSSIAVPITVSGNCISAGTTYKLYLSNVSGTFVSATPIGTFANFYTTFVNGLIPAGTPAGSGYVVKVVASNPAITSTISAPFSIVAGTAVVASIITETINNKYPEILGTCNGGDNTDYVISDQSTPGSTVKASFYNELSQKPEGTLTPTAGGITFTAKAAHYTVSVKAVNGGIVGTKDYLLVNNVVNTSFEVNGSSTICLPKRGAASLTYGVDNTKIINNFPGLVYTVKWGDLDSTKYTLCDIINNGFLINHTYTSSSCGSNPGGAANAFQVIIQLSSLYCGKVGTPVNSFANILDQPVNSFSGPQINCTNSPVTFVNTSNPGQSPNGAGTGCTNTSAKYDWSVDGIAVLRGVPMGQSLVYKFTTPGTHTIKLHFANPLTQTCVPTDTTETICIQDPPQPKFTLPTTTGCAPFTLNPINQSIIDSNCSRANKFIWTVNGPGTVSYANGTNANSAKPQFIFKTQGVYTITLEITTASCGNISTSPQTVVVDAPTVVNMSPDITVCGTGMTQTFGPGGGATQTSITGVAQPQAGTYTWTVTGGAYTFTGGTNQNSQYPQILFTDYATYKVSVKVVSSCATITKTQSLTFDQVPILSITPSAVNICPGSTVTLTGKITGVYNAFQWLGGNGANTGFSPANSLTTTYTPTAAEIQAGSATIILDVKTNLTGPCADVQQSVTINIYPVNTVTSPATLQVCSESAAGYNITSTVAGSTFSWTATGTASGFKNGSGTTINDILKNSSTADETVTYTITPSANGCTGTPFQLVVTVKPLSVLTANAANTNICSGNTSTIDLSSNIGGTIYTWTSTTTGSITGNSRQPTPTGTNAISDVLTNNGTTAGKVTYTIIPYNGSCPGKPVNVIITVEPVPIVAYAGADAEVCNLTSYQLKGNSPSPGTGLWTVSPAGPSFNNAASPTAIATGLAPGNTYVFTWTITPPAPCPANSSSVTITDDGPSVGGTTSGAATVCSTGNGGSITLAGQSGNIVMWQSSTDNFTSVINNIPNQTASLSYNNLTVTTQYRAVIQSGVCSVQNSTVSVITVNKPPVIPIPGNDQNLCGATTTTLNGNSPSPFTGQWTQTSGPTSAVIVSPNSAQTQVTGLIPGNDYTFSWTIKAAAPCTDNSASMTVHDAIDVTGSFTASPTSGCGDLTVQFNNTSTSTAGVSFLWAFGDDSMSTDVNPVHTFKARTDGRDTSYIVSLNVVNNCFQRSPVTQKIVVRPQTPVAYISPRQLAGCAPFTLAVDNLSPGNNVKYTYYLVNNNTSQVDSIVKADKSSITFGPLNATVTTQYTLYMVATGFCNNTGQSAIIPISVAPTNVISQMFIQNNATKGCAPFTATFINNSTGGDSYKYNIYGGPNNDTLRFPASAAPFPYTFTDPGTYHVSITTINSCTNLESAQIEVDVYPVPQPQFKADTTKGCKTLTVTFTNQTPDLPTLPASSMSYVWDFGNGTYVGYQPPPHVFTSTGSPFTVTLTATNPVTNCSATVTQKDLIDVTPPPVTQFTEKPDSVTSIPNYTFSFLDQTINGPVSWAWNFGDNQTSTNRNPEHTYADTGIYKVTLSTVNKNGCDSTITHYVRVTGVPGQLFLPNAFEPNGPTTELRTFMAKGSGIKEWKMQVFNNYSQLIWETTKLDAKGRPVDGWDGTFNGKAMPQGVYLWQVTATFINGTQWKGNVIQNSLPKRVGTIHLIR